MLFSSSDITGDTTCFVILLQCRTVSKTEELRSIHKLQKQFQTFSTNRGDTHSRICYSKLAQVSWIKNLMQIYASF